MAICRPRVLPFVQTNSPQPRLSRRSHRDLHTIISHAIVNVKVEDLHCALARNHTHTDKRFMYTHANVIESHRGEPTSEPKPLTTSVGGRTHISTISVLHTRSLHQISSTSVGLCYTHNPISPKCRLPYTNLIYKIKNIEIYKREREKEK